MYCLLNNNYYYALSVRYMERHNVEVYEAVIEEINANGSEHSDNEIKRKGVWNLLLHFYFFFYRGCISLLWWKTSFLDRPGAILSGSSRKNRENSSRRAKQTQVGIIIIITSWLSSSILCIYSVIQVESKILKGERKGTLGFYWCFIHVWRK